MIICSVVRLIFDLCRLHFSKDTSELAENKTLIKNILLKNSYNVCQYVFIVNLNSIYKTFIN